MSVCLSCNCLNMIMSVNDYVSCLLASIFSVGFCIQSEELFSHSQYLKVDLYWSGCAPRRLKFVGK